MMINMACVLAMLIIVCGQIGEALANSICYSRPYRQVNAIVGADNTVAMKTYPAVPTNFMFTAYVIDYANMVTGFCTQQPNYSVFFSIQFTGKTPYVSIGTRKNTVDGKQYIDVTFTNTAGTSTVYQGSTPILNNRFFFSVRRPGGVTPEVHGIGGPSPTFVFKWTDSANTPVDQSASFGLAMNSLLGQTSSSFLLVVRGTPSKTCFQGALYNLVIFATSTPSSPSDPITEAFNPWEMSPWDSRAYYADCRPYLNLGKATYDNYVHLFMRPSDDVIG